MSFAPRPGCPMCSIVSTPYPSLLQSPRTPFFQDKAGRNGSGTTDAIPPQIVYKDDKVTAYLERANPVSSKGHLVVMLNLHVPSIYMLSSSDLPLLLHMRTLAQSLLSRHVNGTLSGTPTSALMSPPPSSPGAQTIAFGAEADPSQQFNIGFITSPFSDPKIPVKDHVHCHAYAGTLDKAGMWRRINYSGMGWWSMDDLIAEIREQTSNNRIKSGYQDRSTAPINRISDAGARAGFSNGYEVTGESVVSPTSPGMQPRSVPAVAVTPHEDSEAVYAAEEGRAGGEEDSSGNGGGKASAASLKRPLGPRSKDNSSNSIPLARVGSSEALNP